MVTDDRVYLLGIRHHGPGSALSVRTALEQIEPAMILIEGPPEAEAVLPLALADGFELPVALMLYAQADFSQCVFYPFAEYSPEWQALRYGLRRQLPVRFCDLPQSHMLALAADLPQLQECSDQGENEDDIDDEDKSTWGARPPDPLGLLAQAAGFDDGERWWEYVVEHRQQGLEVFAAIGEAMGAVRAAIEADYPPAEREALREAWMRKTLRQALKDCSGNIAVVCGAWHVPALDKKVKVKDDNALLQGLPKTKITATWIPWTYRRLASESGYGAGVAAPGWYEHLWETRHCGEDRATRIATAWLTKAATELRRQGLDVSSASVIEATRLAQTLAALRVMPLPDLKELEEAILTTFCFGDAAPLGLLQERLLIGERLGSVPSCVPRVPLQQDLEKAQKQLRLKPEAVAKSLELDLRKDIGIGRSELLHRLGFLDIPWGKLVQSGSAKGTFKEIWELRWEPEFAIRLIEAGVYGGTILQASTAKAIERLRQAEQLAEITDLIHTLLLANLPQGVRVAVERLRTEAAVAADIQQLMGCLPALVRISRYGNVRGTETHLLNQVIDGIVPRICIGLPQACQSLDADAGRIMMGQIEATTQALRLLDDAEHLTRWWATLTALTGQRGLNGLVGGKCYRLLLDGGLMESETAARELQFVLSQGADLIDQAGWIEGLLDGSGLLLLHDDGLWAIIDAWLCQLDEEHFIALLPLLRRAFSGFEQGERRQLLNKALSLPTGSKGLDRFGANTQELDLEWAEAGLPVIARLLGIVLEPGQQTVEKEHNGD